MGKKQGYWFDFDNYVHPEQGPHEYFLGNSFNDSGGVSFSLFVHGKPSGWEGLPMISMAKSFQEENRCLLLAKK